MPRIPQNPPPIWHAQPEPEETHPPARIEFTEPDEQHDRLAELARAFPAHPISRASHPRGSALVRSAQASAVQRTGPAIPARQIRAVFDSDTVRVYQAYPASIADAALEHGRFVSPPFKMERMTWIKPSFLWMMYRSGWAQKEGQQRILAIDLSREGFEWALSHATLSGRDRAGLTGAPDTERANGMVRVQWDPERDLSLAALPYRTIQIGLSGEAVEHFVTHWTRKITDVTALAHQLSALVEAGEDDQARALLPAERPWPVSPPLAKIIDLSTEG